MKKLLILVIVSTSVLAAELQSFIIPKNNQTVNFKVIQISKDSNDDYQLKFDKIFNHESDINQITSSAVSSKIISNSELVKPETIFKIEKNMTVKVQMYANNQCFNIETNYSNKIYQNQFCLSGEISLINKFDNKNYIYLISTTDIKKGN